jgi:hypothetical protein
MEEKNKEITSKTLQKAQRGPETSLDEFKDIFEAFGLSPRAGNGEKRKRLRFSRR